MTPAATDAHVDRRLSAERRNHSFERRQRLEIALLVDIRRIELDLPIEAWLTRFVERPGVEALPLGHSAASRSYRLYQLAHRNPADRLLIASAIKLACLLVTYDERILRFAAEHGRQYRFAADS